ncbi:DUF1190 family protein [Dickeya undicola]|uniref:DUF1190 family protein n=1 Tax=Dickeya undicola TaxID=1577887 RepID=A0A3N0G2T1_9GAMM|nr:DUF1190 family protein [Dickeya undicola]RNM06576.1 DUF1190 family protein [Dickeya undicola]RNM25425.1 DUF1190 family protein [Dickeya undicola]
MKRTSNINHARFRKRWGYRIAPIALAVGAVFILSGCEKTDETVSLYQNADDCSRANPSMKDQCTATYNSALKEAERTAPKYATREECVAAFGESQCTQSSTTSTTSAANTTASAAPQQSGSFWMPLMAGFMMGKLMGGSSFAQQPVFSPRTPNSPANGSYVDASGKSYGTATGRSITVPKDAMAPKPTSSVAPSSITTTRGGFGDSVNKLNSAPAANMAGNQDSTRAATNTTGSSSTSANGSSTRQTSSSIPVRRSFGG